MSNDTLYLIYCHTFGVDFFCEYVIICVTLNNKEGIIMPRTGRPKVQKPKSVKYSIRLDEETEENLIAYCVRCGITKGEAIRRGIEMLLRGER